MPITRDILIEDLVEQLPESVAYFLNKGMACILCGEPIWGTLEEAARGRGFADEDIDKFVDDLNNMSG
jgi:methionine synthase II (cobalamin-independent)